MDTYNTKQILSKIPLISGSLTQNVVHWITQWDQAMNRLHLDANSQIIQLELKLTSSASLWYEQLSPLKKMDTTTILEELLTKFNTLAHHEALLTQLDKLKQNKRTIEEYAYKLQHLCKEINSKMEDEEKL
jgi:hypothetical protein